MAPETATVPRSHASRVLTLPLLGAAVLLLVFAVQVRHAEAAVQAGFLQLVGLDARAVGAAVIFPLEGRWFGVGFSLGCSIAPLTALFLGGAGIAAWMRPLRLRSVGLGVLALVGLFMLANQIRIAIIVGAMHFLGFQRGYEMSHVFLGSAITTLGFVAAVVLFVRLLLREPEGAAR